MDINVCVWITLAVLIDACIGQFNDFSNNLRDFRLTTDNSFPSRGDNVTLLCRRTQNFLEKTSRNLLDQDDRITWEENNRAIVSTAVDRKGRCRVTRESSFLVASSFGQNSEEERLGRISCRDDGTTVRVTIYDWTPGQLSGDKWRCVQFPFADSNDLDIQSFVPLLSATISQSIDKGAYFTPSRGTIVTCVSSPCRPIAYIEWFVEDPISGEMRLTSHSDIEESVETNKDGVSVTVSSLLFNQNSDHGMDIYCKASNRENSFQAVSDQLSLVVTYPPSIDLQVKPDASVLEGSDVTLECSTAGRPVPEVKWIRKGVKSNKKGSRYDRVISLSPSVNLQSVTMSDSGQYDCVATNGLEPDARESVVLLVRERPPSPSPIIKSDDPSPSLQSSATSSSSSSLPLSSSKSSVDGGAIAGIVIAVIIVIIIVGVVIFRMLRRRWGKQDIVVGDNNSFRSAGMLDTEGQGIYAMCSPLPPIYDLPPYYMDLLPPSYPERKTSNVANPGYGLDDSVIGPGSTNSKNDRRPLPSTPYDADMGYEVINDVPSAASLSANRNGSSVIRQPISVQDNDGYEVPVTPAAKASNSVYDSAAMRAISRAPTERSAARDRPFLDEFPANGSGNKSAGGAVSKADDISSSCSSSRSSGKRLSQESEQNTPL